MGQKNQHWRHDGITSATKKFVEFVFLGNELEVEPAMENQCKAFSLHAGHPNSEFHPDDRVLLEHKSVMDDALENFRSYIQM